MKTINKKTYQMPEVARVELDSDISLTLDSANSPIVDPEVMMLDSDPLFTDQVIF